MNCFMGKELSADCLESILQTLAEGLFIIDTSGIIKYCNNALLEMTGKTREEIIGQTCCSLMKDHCTPPPTCNLFKAGSLINAECELTPNTGGTIQILKNAKVLFDSDGNITGAVETLTDISSLRISQNRVQELEKHLKSRDRMGKIVGKSHAIKEIFNLIELSSASNATVLITGETGTGKELAAAAIHQNSPRRDGPFVKLNCSALPEALLESELFGHTKGSFTGAFRDKTGKFELADKGTLFLDEIGELSPLIQVKLLRFLQEREFERVGDNIVRKSDVRIIAATHRDLRKMIYDGTFRQDLFYRLKVFPIHIPSLRERKEDIGLLIDHFVNKFNSETGKKIVGLTHDAAVTMMDYCWPGNIRELENAIEHAFVTCQGTHIDLFDIPLEIRKVELRKGICTTTTPELIQPRQYPLPVKRTQLSDEEFKRVLIECNGNQSEAARRLGVDRTTVWRKMKKVGVGLKPTPTGIQYPG